MLWSKLFIPTLRTEPAGVDSGAERLLLRAGYARQTGSGWGYLDLGARSLYRIAQIFEWHLAKVDAQRVLFPQGASVEGLIEMFRGELRSYRQLPQVFVSEGKVWTIRLENGMHSELQIALIYGVGECGIMPETFSFGIGFRSDSGDEEILRCPFCGVRYAFPWGRSTLTPPLAADPEGDSAPEAFHTPERKTIAEVAEFTGLPATSQMKSLVMIAGEELVLALVRGDHQISREKLAKVLRVPEVRPATAAEIVERFGAEPGSLGPVGIKGIRIVADRALEARRNMICGANRDDYHLRNVTPGRDFEAPFFDLRRAAEGEPCEFCETPLVTERFFPLVRWDPDVTVEFRVDGPDGTELPVTIGQYEVDYDRILRAMFEQSCDANGPKLPQSIAPFDAVITPVSNADAALRDAAQRIYDECRELGLDVLYDDRDERAGVKFKDFDLTGIPWRITIGGKKLAAGNVELLERRTGAVRDVAVEAVAAELQRTRPMRPSGQ
jgi:prolyl-tRNA synthetase